jgi:anthranilate synthase component 1
MVRPGYSEIIRLAEQYDIIPVCREIYADITTPIAVLKAISRSSNRYFLLESIEGGEKWGRYSFLGYSPIARITCRNGETTIEESCVPRGTTLHSHRKTLHSRKPLEVLRNYISQYRAPALPDIPPFAGGFVGYFAYGMIGYAEPVLKLRHGESNDFDVMLFDRVIAYDHLKQKISIVVNMRTDNIEENYRKALSDIADVIRLIKEQALPDPKTHGIAGPGKNVGPDMCAQTTGKVGEDMRAETTGEAGAGMCAETTGEAGAGRNVKAEEEFKPVFICNTTKEEYCGMVEKAKEYIMNGDIFQAVISRRFETEYRGSLIDAYRVLRTTNPSPYMVMMQIDDVQLISTSPETLVRLKDVVLSTFPLAGTRPRGKDRNEDKALEEELLADEKELAEHDMLVDLARNDLGRISKYSSVHVTNYKMILRYSRVMHIASEVESRIRDDRDAFDAIEALLPAGTLSGAPKIRACEIIDELEKEPRGIYGGAIGYVDFTGNMDACIAIRMAVKKGDRVYVQAGAGIVYDSIPEREYEESGNKARAVMEAIIGASEVDER